MTTQRIKVNLVRAHAGLEVWPMEEPYASQYRNVAGLQANLIHQGVQFSRAMQRRLGMARLRPITPLDWATIPEAGACDIEIEIAAEQLQELAVKSAEIDRIVASAVAAPTTYACAGRADGCAERVRVRGDYCPRCAHDR